MLGVGQARLDLGDGGEQRPSGQASPPSAETGVGTLFVPAGREPTQRCRAFPPGVHLTARRCARPRRARARGSRGGAATTQRLGEDDDPPGGQPRSPLAAHRDQGGRREPRLALGATRCRGSPTRQLETMRKESQRLDRLVANLLDFSRLETAPATPNRQLIATDDLVASALAELEADEQAVRVELPATTSHWSRSTRCRSSAPSSTCSRTRSASRRRARRSGDRSHWTAARPCSRSPTRDAASLEDDLERVFEPFERGRERRPARVSGSRSPAASPRRTAAGSGS